MISPILTQMRTWSGDTSGLETERGLPASLTLSNAVGVEDGVEGRVGGWGNATLLARGIRTPPPPHRVRLLECKFGDWPEASKS